MFGLLASKFGAGLAGPFDFIVVDEAQDIGVAQLRFLAALGGRSRREGALFFAGDLGQRIFQQPFSWKALGVDVRGRSSTLQDQLSHVASDPHAGGPAAGAGSGRMSTEIKKSARERSRLFNGPRPSIRVLKTRGEECGAVSEWLKERLAGGVAPCEIGIFVRSARRNFRGRTRRPRGPGCLTPYSMKRWTWSAERASIGTMHLAKGLEFRAVAAMACDDEVIPLQERIETADDAGELEEVYATERHLLYVACTRARDDLLVTGVAPASEFLDDLGAGG